MIQSFIKLKLKKLKLFKFFHLLVHEVSEYFLLGPATSMSLYISLSVGTFFQPGISSVLGPFQKLEPSNRMFAEI